MQLVPTFDQVGHHIHKASPRHLQVCEEFLTTTMPAAALSIPVPIDDASLKEVHIQREDAESVATNEHLLHDLARSDQSLGAAFAAPRERRRTASMATSALVAALMFSWNSGT